MDFDRHLEEAAADLGANEWVTFRKVTPSLLALAILAGGLLAFAISVDDFVITYFNSGSEITFPVYVWGQAARRATAGERIGSAIFFIAVGVMLASVIRQSRRERRPAIRARPPPTSSSSPADHLWMHFTRMGGYSDQEVPIIVRGEGATWRTRTGSATSTRSPALLGEHRLLVRRGDRRGALEQMRELPFYTNWSYAHPRAIELAREVASLAPGDLNRVFFVSGGSEAVESAWKLARQYYTARGEKRLRGATHEPERSHDAIVAAHGSRRYKAIARHIAYHGTTPGALSINGIPALRRRSSRSSRSVRHVRNTNRYHRPVEETEEEFTQGLLDDLEQTILAMGSETVCIVHMEPVQNVRRVVHAAAGYWQGVRALCDEYDILLSADEVITAFGRLGYWFGSERYDIRPDIVTCAKGLSSSYAAIGAVIATDRVMEPFLESTSIFSHGITFGGHPTMCAIALKNIEIMRREGIVEHVSDNEALFREKLETLLDLPIVGDVRGTGFSTLSSS